MKRMLSILLCCLLLSGCAIGSEEAYVPTGNGLTWDDGYTGPGQETDPEEEEQALVLTCYPELTMNPLKCNDFTNRTLFPLLYQSLFVVDREYQVEPMLVKSYSRSQDMKTYTFYLENATFSDGTRLTAEDVVATLEAARESAIYSGRMRHISQITIEGGAVVVELKTAYENLPILLDIPILKASQLEEDYPLGTGP